MTRDVLVKFPELNALVLDRTISDHRHIFLAHEKLDYGPRPFNFYNLWMLEEDFDIVFCSFLGKKGGNVGDSAPIFFKEKLKGLIIELWEWWNKVNQNRVGSKNMLFKRFHDIDLKIDVGMAMLEEKRKGNH